MRTVYLIGEPGSGKSTAMRSAIELAGWSSTGEVAIPRLRWTEYRTPDGWRAAQLGLGGGTFPGTDRLSMSAHPVAIDWLQSIPAHIIVGEGDRLATDGFLRAAAEVSHLTVCVMATDSEESARRRAARGTSQSASWVKGRITKTARLAQHWCAIEVRTAVELSEILVGAER